MIEKVVRVSEMQAIEKEANHNGLSYEAMMANAGSGLARVIQDRYGGAERRGILGLVGSGNNGGDTLIALTHLATAGWKTCAVLVRERSALDPALRGFKEAGGQIVDFQQDFYPGEIRRLLQENEFLLDGILGTGFKLPIHGRLSELMTLIKNMLEQADHKIVVIAVDCPSGVDCDSGAAAPECLPAQLTAAMAAVKQGLLCFPAFKFAGEIVTVDIGLQNGEYLSQTWQGVNTFIPDSSWVRQALPARPLDAHKGTFGTALVIAGSQNFSGAALLAGQAAYRSGAGLVTLAVPDFLQSALAGHLPEATWLPLPSEDGAISARSAAVIRSLLPRVEAVLVGCGFGQAETTRQFVDQLLKEEATPPLIFDADGLRLISTLPDWYERLPAESILTPHPGEMAQLTGRSVLDVQSNRLATAKEYSRLWNQIVVLKGAGTIIAHPSGETAIIPVATPALARAGTGDVLAGWITGLRAQGAAAFTAAAAGSWIHARGGQKAAQNLGSSAGVLASDVLRGCVQVVAELE